MNLNDIFNPSTVVGALLIRIAAKFIVNSFTKNDDLKLNNIKIQNNYELSFSDSKMKSKDNSK